MSGIKEELRGLSPKGLQALKPEPMDRLVSVIGMPNLRIRVEPTGTLSARVVRVMPGSGRKINYQLGTYRRGIGRLTGLTLPEIRQRYERAMKLIDDRIHPTDEDARLQEAAAAKSRDEALTMTVNRAVTLFVCEHLAKLSESSDGTWYRDPDNRAIPNRRPWARGELLGFYRKPPSRPLLYATFLSIFGARKVHSLDAREIMAFLKEMITGQKMRRGKGGRIEGILRIQTGKPTPVRRNSLAAANRVYTTIKSLFGYLKGLGLRENPLEGTHPPGGSEPPRKRQLSPSELVTTWRLLDSAPLRLETRIALKLLLVTGVRRGELTAARREHVDFDAKFWLLPPANAREEGVGKVGADGFLVPLSDLAVDLFLQLFAAGGESQWVLPSPRKVDGDQPFSERALSQAVRECRKHFGYTEKGTSEAWTPHDLRRTLRTMLSALGISAEIAELVVNHEVPSLSKVHKTYDLWAFADEKKEALEIWSGYLGDVIAGTDPEETRKKWRK